MSDLREQLQSLKDEYRTARYPGNLADDLLNQDAKHDAPSHGWRIVALTTAACGLAAAILIAIPLLYPDPSRPASIARTTTVTPTTNPTNLIGALATLPTLPQIPSESSLPSDAPLVPSGESMEIGAMPSMPSMDFGLSSLSETQEPT